MIKKTLLALILIIALGFGIIQMILNSIKMEWGHYFIFKNELGIEIDSLEISIGDKKTMIYAGNDSLSSLESKINVPKYGYPHEVILKIFNKDKLFVLEADSFNCYNCDGYHQYILKPSRAEYKFLY